jgi:O-antigen/teichoic acid export membrane protein
MMASVLPFCLALVALGPDLLRLWLGTEFATGGGRVLQILAIGIFFSCLAFAPGALLDAIGRPDVNAKWQLAQAALFLPLSALGLIWLGIEGAAAAWAARCAMDSLGRLWFCARLYPAAAPAVRANLAPLIAGGIGLCALLPFQDHAWLAALSALALAGFALAGWRALTPEERRDAKVLLRRPSRLRAVLRGEAA